MLGGVAQLVVSSIGLFCPGVALLTVIGHLEGVVGGSLKRCREDRLWETRRRGALAHGVAGLPQMPERGQRYAAVQGVRRGAWGGAG